MRGALLADCNPNWYLILVCPSSDAQVGNALVDMCSPGKPRRTPSASPAHSGQQTGTTVRKLSKLSHCIRLGHILICGESPSCASQERSEDAVRGTHKADATRMV